MDSSAAFDILIIGSGPAGAHAAQSAIASGLRVGMVDVGQTDTHYAHRVPSLPFTQIRQSDPKQKEYFLGDNIEEVFDKKRKAGTHLTPARYHMIEKMDELFPTRTHNFFCLQSCAQGGLAAGWGGNCFTYEDCELKKIGLSSNRMRFFYDEAMAEIGVSAEPASDLYPSVGTFPHALPALQIDTNTESIVNRYSNNKEWFSRNGFCLGKSPLAVLSRRQDDRGPNPYFDMDFWADINRSVYRPRYTIEKLTREPNFHYEPGMLAKSFHETTAGEVAVHCQNIDTDHAQLFRARRLILAAGAINTGKLALASAQAYSPRLPLLCNPNYWVAALNWSQLGIPARDERYSLSQLTATLRTSNDPDYVVGQFYSYRSLLFFRLLHDMPLPPALGLLLLRLISSSLTVINMHFSDKPAPQHRWLQLKKGPTADELVLSASYTPNELTDRENQLRKFLRCLFKLGCLPFRIVRPIHGASIHYAGTLPFSEQEQPFSCHPSGRLYGYKNVYIADSSPWRFLPSKGLTLTIMAQARKVAAEVSSELKNETPL
ncbi:MAG: GMC family oxidoreductase [Deltaproteobacteria bacterium]|nr:GMC family oxidoreductase [Deltaproteobacteria bacterium]